MVIVFFGFVSLSFGKVPEPSKDAFFAFVSALVDADTGSMGKFYDGEVFVLRGSTILDQKYIDHRDKNKDHLIKRESLLKAYQLLIDDAGGEPSWRARRKPPKKNDLLYIDHESHEKRLIRPGLKAAQLWAAFKAKPRDILAILDPKGDMAVFQLRKVGGKWLVVGEAWD